MNSRIKPPRTHIDTLADGTPKARRRVRALFGAKPTDLVGPSSVRDAQALAYSNERAEARRVATERQSKLSPSS